MTNQKPKTVAEFKQHLKTQDTTITRWAQQQKLTPAIVYQALGGRLSGHHGQARKVFRAMGITPPADQLAGKP